MKGWLSPEHTAIFDKLIGPLAGPAGAGDDRDHAQRTADTLMNLLSHRHKRTAATVIIDLDTLQGASKPARLLGGGGLAAEEPARSR